jgi:hypothetical protein
MAVPLLAALAYAVAIPVGAALWKGYDFLTSAKEAGVSPIDAVTKSPEQWPQDTIVNLPKYPDPPSYGSEPDAWKAWTPVTLQATQATMIEAYKKAYTPVIATRNEPASFDTIDPMLLAMGLAGGVALLMLVTRR